MDDSNPSPSAKSGDQPVERVEREHSVMEGLPAAKAERVAAMRRELADLQRQLSEAQQRIAAEMQARAEDDDRIEALEARVQTAEAAAAQVEDLRRDMVARDAELHDARKQLESLRTVIDEAKTAHAKELEEVRSKHNALTDEIAGHSAIVAERDTLKAELETVRAELEAGRTKARDVATQFAKFSQELADGGILLPTRDRPHPPPIPPPRPSAASIPVPAVEEIIEVKAEPEEPKRSGLGGTLLMLVGGVILGSIVTYTIVASSSSSASPTTSAREEAPSMEGAGAQPAQEPIAQPQPTPTPAQPEATNTVAPTTVAAPVAADVTAVAAPVQAPPASDKTDGVLILPDEAEGHRLFVDGKKIEFAGDRATVPCGTHEIRIGSRGAPRTLDIPCGGETTMQAAPL